MRLCELCKFKVQSSEEKGNLPLKEKENFASMAMALTACFRPSFFGISRRCLPKQLKLLICESEYLGKFLIFLTAMYFVRKKWAVGISSLQCPKGRFLQKDMVGRRVQSTMILEIWILPQQCSEASESDLSPMQLL